MRTPCRYWHCVALADVAIDSPHKLLTLRVLIHTLPLYNRFLLLKLLSFLSLAAAHAHTTHMTTDNLALVFAVNILRFTLKSSLTLTLYAHS